MKSSDELKKTVKVWADKIGQAEAIRQLVIARVSVAVAQKLVVGKYAHNPGFDASKAMIRLLKRDGFVLKD